MGWAGKEVVRMSTSHPAVHLGIESMSVLTQHTHLPHSFWLKWPVSGTFVARNRVLASLFIWSDSQTILVVTSGRFRMLRPGIASTSVGKLPLAGFIWNCDQGVFALVAKTEEHRNTETKQDVTQKLNARKQRGTATHEQRHKETRNQQRKETMNQRDTLLSHSLAYYLRMSAPCHWISFLS